jgi:hypothetical protein
MAALFDRGRGGDCVSFAARLDRELAARGVPRRERSRIRLEYEDHAACDAGAEGRLGDPVALARDFADELATDRARRGAWLAVGVLALAAVALAVSQLAVGGASRAADAHTIWALWLPGLFGIAVGPQVALVVGAVAAFGSWRRRGEKVLPAASIALIDRRAMVAVGGGMTTTLGLILYAFSFAGSEPAWWMAVVAGTAALVTVMLAGVAWRVRRTAAIAVSLTGPAGDVFDDLRLTAIGPAGARWTDALRDHSRLLGAALCVAVGILVAAGTGHAESSLAEGLQRGAFEGAAAAVGFVGLGGRLGLRL